MLQIIPAIDLMNHQAVRLQKGDFETRETVSENAVQAAQHFADAGATRLHIVDLDGARTGKTHNRETIAQIIAAVPQMAVQVGGGVRSQETAQALLDLGAQRVIIGTTAAGNEAVMSEMLNTFGDKLIIGADSKNGFIAVRGWAETTGETTEAFCLRLKQRGAARFLFTDVARDGMLQGVNADETARLARAVGVPFLASGGVSGIDDIITLRALQPNGVEGVIIGKALYSGALNLADALRIAAE